VKNTLAISSALASLPTSARSSSRNQLFSKGEPNLSPVASGRAPGSFFESSEWSINTDKALARERVTRSTSLTRSSIRDGWRVVIGRPLRAFEKAQLNRATGRAIRPGTRSKALRGHGGRIGAGARLTGKDGTVERGMVAVSALRRCLIPVPTWNALQCYPDTHPDKQCGRKAGDKRTSRVQLAHPSGPAVATQLSQSGNASLRTHPRKGVSCGRTTRTEMLTLRIAGV
jgi:hypothetical protein